MGEIIVAAGVFGLAWWILSQQAQAAYDSATPYPQPSSPVPDETGGPAIMPADANLQAKIEQFISAIAHAEGFGVPGAIPTVFHNPGDLGPGDTGYPGEFHDGSNVSKLPDDETGWGFLRRKITRAFTGESHVFSTSMTIAEFAQEYAGDWQNWSRNVAQYLGVTPDTVIADWLNA